MKNSFMKLLISSVTLLFGATFLHCSGPQGNDKCIQEQTRFREEDNKAHAEKFPMDIVPYNTNIQVHLTVHLGCGIAHAITWDQQTGIPPNVNSKQEGILCCDGSSLTVVQF